MSDAGDLEQLSAMVEDQGGPERSTGVCYSSTPHDAAFVVVVRRPWQSQNVIWTKWLRIREFAVLSLVLSTVPAQPATKAPFATVFRRTQAGFAAVLVVVCPHAVCVGKPQHLQTPWIREMSEIWLIFDNFALKSGNLIIWLNSKYSITVLGGEQPPLVGFRIIAAIKKSNLDL